MPLSHLPALLASAFAALAHWLRPTLRRPPAPAACSASSSPAAAAPSPPGSAPPASPTTSATATPPSAPSADAPTAWPSPSMHAVRPLLDTRRLLLAIDDTPTPRYGPYVEGCWHPPQPQPRPRRREVRLRPRLGHPGRPGQAPRLGHHRLALAGPALHPRKRRGQAAPRAPAPLPHQAGAGRRAAALAESLGRPPLRAALGGGRWRLRQEAVPEARQASTAASVVSRLRKDAALCVAARAQAGRPARARRPTYGKKRIVLAKRAGQTRGWQQVECVQYGEKVTKTIKTFLATWRPAGGRDPGGAGQGGGRLAGRSSAPTRRRRRRRSWRRWPTAARSSRRTRTSRRCGARASSRCATCTATRAAST